MSDIQNFCDITGATPNIAQQYLEMSKNNLDLAIELFFDSSSSKKPVIEPKKPVMPPGPRPVKPIDQTKLPNNKNIIDQIFDQANKGGAPAPDDPSEGDIQKHKITFWKNGFQIDDGEFRNNTDPENADFLDSISKGRIPRELSSKGVVDINIEDNRTKDYVKPKVPFNPFGGQSRNLENSINKQPQKPIEKTIPIKINFVKDNEPSTKIRIQFSNGNILTLTVPLSSTINDLKRFIIENRPDLKINQINLSTTFPIKDITNSQGTIQSEGLKMSTILVK